MAYCTCFIVCTSMRPISNLPTLSIIYLGSLRVRLTLCIVFACPCYFVCLFIYIFFSLSRVLRVTSTSTSAHLSTAPLPLRVAQGSRILHDLSPMYLGSIPFCSTHIHTVLLSAPCLTSCPIISELTLARLHLPCPFVPFIWRLYQFAFHAICEGISGSLVADLRYYEGHPVCIAIQCRVT